MIVARHAEGKRGEHHYCVDARIELWSAAQVEGARGRARAGVDGARAKDAERARGRGAVRYTRREGRGRESEGECGGERRRDDGGVRERGSERR